MSRVYSKGSFDITVYDPHKENIRDVAKALKEEIQKSDLRLSIDTAGLLNNLVEKCIEC